MRAGDSRARCHEDDATGNGVYGGGKCTHGRDNITNLKYGTDGWHYHAIELRGGRKCNRGNGRDSSSASNRNGSREAETCGEGE